MTTAYLGLGSNVGDRMVNLAEAIDRVSRVPSTHVERVSEVYESAAAYGAGPGAFLNAVARVETQLPADALLGYLQQIESEMGRVRTEEQMVPRVIDLDIELFGDEEWNRPDLTIPHPRLLERDFVVTPLLEIAPDAELPDGTPVTRDEVSVGMIAGSHGPLAHVGDDENAPVIAGEWVEVARSNFDNDVVAGWDSGILFKREVLEEAGIPYAFDPYEPGTDMDPFGMPVVFRLLVPGDDAERAATLLAEVMAAPPEPFPEA